MIVTVKEESCPDLDAYGSISIAYVVREVIDVSWLTRSDNTATLKTRPLATRTTKDYDALPGNGPLDWPQRFDISSWGFIRAEIDGTRAGGVALMMGETHIEVLPGSEHAALIWDLRVAPQFRGNGAGSALLSAAENWARSRGATSVDVETQNTNVPACRFYLQHGYRLQSQNTLAYPDLPDEVQLIFSKSVRKHAF